jgi:carbonic anhydrase/acetyltransferase-like protein (isoleucine patch superfamily)
MDNAILEDYVMLGAGALVPPGKVLQSGYLKTSFRKNSDSPLACLFIRLLCCINSYVASYVTVPTPPYQVRGRL